MREHLLGYLLEALDADEQEAVELELNRSPSLRLELNAIVRKLGDFSEARRGYQPPDGLTQRTCALVEKHRRQHVVTPAGQTAAISAEPLAGRWTLADLIVAAGILLAASALFFPAIASSRHTARIAQCQNNLGRLSIALHDYSERIGNRCFPYVPPVGNRAYAGYYATVLMDHGLINSQRLLICPDSPLAGMADHFYVPTREEVDQADGQLLARLRQTGGGSYGYNLGIDVDGVHRPPRNANRPYFAIMADTPMRRGSEQWSANHGGRGFNLLFEDGHVRFFLGYLSDQCRDDPFLNRYGLVAPGVDVDDSVIAGSETAPVIRVRHAR